MNPKSPKRELSTSYYADLIEVAKAGQRAAALTKQFLEPRVLDLKRVSSDMDRLLRSVIGDDIHLINTPAADLWPIKVDPGQMEQVLLTLALHARDAMPEGGTLMIKTANVDLDENFAGLHPPLHPGPHVLLSVSDTGCGMTPETRAHIFEPVKSRGLGLAILHGIVRQNKGSIWAYSEPGQGTTFKLYLPCVPGPVEAAGTPRGRETVLLAEDETPVRNLVRLLLENQGYTVIEASSGPDAMEISRRHSGPVHLLVTDMVMPGMNGLELADHISRCRPGIAILFMSGSPNEVLDVHGPHSPRATLLQKPFTAAQLALQVRASIDAK